MVAERRLTSEDGGLYRKLAKIAIPISIQGVVSATLGLVDNLMVGFLGEAELAAVGIATQIFYIFYGMLFGFVSGSATFMAQFYGMKDYENIRKVVGFAISAALSVAVLFFTASFFFTEHVLGIYASDPELIAIATPYVKIGAVTFFFMSVAIPFEMAFKTTQQTKVPMVVSGVVFVTNVTLNYILIFGKFGAPALGVTGASIATTIARFLEILVILYFVARKNNCFRGPITSYFHWKKEMLVRILKNAMPTTINELLWSTGQSMYVAAFSRIGTTAYAAYQAAAAINSLFIYGAFSIGDATLVLVGEKLGQGKKEETYALSKKLLKIGVVVGFVVGVSLILLAKPMVGLFNLSDEGKIFAFRILLVYGICMALNIYNGMQIVGTLRGGGDTTFTMLAESSCIWLIAVPLAFVASLVFHLPIYLAVLLIKLEDVVKFFLLTKRFISKKWLNTVITGL